MGLERLLEIVLRAAIRLVNAYLGPSSPLPPPSRPRTTPVYASVNDLSRFFSIHSYPPSPFMSPSSLAPFSFFSQDTANRASRKTLQTRKITRHCGEHVLQPRPLRYFLALLICALSFLRVPFPTQRRLPTDIFSAQRYIFLLSPRPFVPTIGDTIARNKLRPTRAPHPFCRAIIDFKYTNLLLLPSTFCYDLFISFDRSNSFPLFPPGKHDTGVSLSTGSAMPVRRPFTRPFTYFR